jgi:DNA-binding transcriptional LysR family regulator
MDLAALRTFVAVARRGGFSAVARTQGVEPSSVSRVVAAVERELGERLFHRTTRKLTLTEAGAAYLARVEPLIAQFEEATEEVRAHGRGPVGTVRLSTSVAFGLAMIVPLLGRFRAAFPAMRLELIMNDANLDLVGEGVDLAIRLAPGVDANVIASKLFDTRYHVVAAPPWCAAHPLARPEDLAHLPALRFALPGFRDRWLFRGDGDEVLTVPVDGKLILSSPLALRDAALASLGPALLPDWLIGRNLQNGSLIDCFPAMRATATDFATGAWLIYPSKDFLPNKVRVTIDFLRLHLGRLSGVG